MIFPKVSTLQRVIAAATELKALGWSDRQIDGATGGLPFDECAEILEAHIASETEQAKYRAELKRLEGGQS